MKTPILFTFMLVGALVVVIKQSPSKHTVFAEPLTSNAHGSPPDLERPSILSGTPRGTGLERVLSANQALTAIERLLSEPNHSGTEKAIEEAILNALRGMKKSDRGSFLRDATNLIAQSDLPDRNRILEFATQKWAESDVDGVSAWAASSEEEIGGVALPAIGMAMAEWTPEEAAAWVASQEDLEPHSDSGRSLTEGSADDQSEDRAMEEASRLEGEPESIQETIARVMPPMMGKDLEAAGGWARALSDVPDRGEANQAIE